MAMLGNFIEVELVYLNDDKSAVLRVGNRYDIRLKGVYGEIGKKSKKSKEGSLLLNLELEEIYSENANALLFNNGITVGVEDIVEVWEASELYRFD